MSFDFTTTKDSLSTGFEEYIVKLLEKEGINCRQFFCYMRNWYPHAWDPHPGHTYIQYGFSSAVPEDMQNVDVRNSILHIANEIKNNAYRPSRRIENLYQETWFVGIPIGDVHGQITFLLMRSLDGADLEELMLAIYENKEEFVKFARELNYT